ncbi:SCO family protein [Bacteroidota bacterium]
MKSKYLLVIILFLAMTSCQKKDNKLPVLGRKEIIPKTENGNLTYDTVYHTIPDFVFIDQDSNIITNTTFKDKIYIADFFFTTCPTICPVMKAQMLRIYDRFIDEDRLLILSHTIDPDYDDVGVLHEFSNRLGAMSSKWHFVTGEKEAIYEIGQNSYMITAMEDENEPGGYIHSGAFILVDKYRRIRGMYDGTDANQVDRMINDISKLLLEYE